MEINGPVKVLGDVWISFIHALSPPLAWLIKSCQYIFAGEYLIIFSAGKIRMKFSDLASALGLVEQIAG